MWLQKLELDSETINSHDYNQTIVTTMNLSTSLRGVPSRVEMSPIWL